MSTSVRQFPRVMPLARVAREVLLVDAHDAYKLARHGKLPGTFKVGKHWYVSLPAMIAGMQSGASERGGALRAVQFDGILPATGGRHRI